MRAAQPAKAAPAAAASALRGKPVLSEDDMADDEFFLQADVGSADRECEAGPGPLPAHHAADALPGLQPHQAGGRPQKLSSQNGKERSREGGQQALLKGKPTGEVAKVKEVPQLHRLGKLVGLHPQQQLQSSGRGGEGSGPAALKRTAAALGGIRPQMKAAGKGALDGRPGQQPLRTRAEGGRKRRKKG